MQRSSSGRKPNGAIAFDIGTHLIRTLRHDGPRLMSRSQQLCYAVLPAGRASERRLIETGATYSRCEEGFLVLGSEAVNLCQSHPVPLVKAMPEGIVPVNDVVGRQILSLLVDAVLPPTGAEEICMISHSLGDARSIEFFRGLIRLRGYEPVELRPATAGGVVALADFRMTGVAVDLGAATCEIAVLGTGRELAYRHVLGGGGELDKHFFSPKEHRFTDDSGQSYRDELKPRLEREAACDADDYIIPTPLLRPYRALADQIAEGIVDAFEEAYSRYPFRRPTRIAIFGGLVRDRHLLHQVSNKLSRRDSAEYFAREFHLYRDDLVTARGLLLTADIESASAVERAA